ncbi:MAG: TraX family protein [Marvinbryantia sp.]|jgi:hypothetical protein
MHSFIKPFISGSTLKLIAIITMMIDHTGAAVIGPLRYSLPADSVLREFCILAYPHMRSIGRLAFPIFCFLLVEGFLHTRNATRYAGRLFVFALISELPFDFGLTADLFNWRHQNVYFTLLFGLLVMMAFKWLDENRVRNNVGWFFCLLLQTLTAAAAMFLAKEMYTDYGYKGVFIITLLYILRKNRHAQALLGAAAFSWENLAPLSFLPIWLYNGKRGRQMKYVYYWFYPVHLILLGIVKRFVTGIW